MDVHPFTDYSPLSGVRHAAACVVGLQALVGGRSRQGRCCYYLEYDTPRAGSFEPLKRLPVHKSVVLGSITSKLPQLEDQDDLVKRVHNTANIMVSRKPKRTFEEVSLFVFAPPA